MWWWDKCWKDWQNPQMSDEPERKLDETWEDVRMRKKNIKKYVSVMYVLTKSVGYWIYYYEW